MISRRRQELYQKETPVKVCDKLNFDEDFKKGFRPYMDIFSTPSFYSTHGVCFGKKFVL